MTLVFIIKDAKFRTMWIYVIYTIDAQVCSQLNEMQILAKTTCRGRESKEPVTGRQHAHYCIPKSFALI